TAGSATVTVFNTTPGGGTSGGQTFTINTPAAAPTISSLSPTSATKGDLGFTLTVTGTNFEAASTVTFNGVDLATTFGSSTSLTASVSAANLSSAGIFDVKVRNGAPGNLLSTAAAFTVNNLVPTASSLSPTSKAAGGTTFTLTVNGSNFDNSTLVKWNGSNLTTTFVNGTQVTASVPSGNIASTGTAAITVFNPTPGGGTSTPDLTFTITFADPAITTISPATGSTATALSLTVNGTGFLNGDTVKINGVSLVTTFNSSVKLTAAVTANDVSSPGVKNITVVHTAAAGGAASGTASLTISNPYTTPAAQVLPYTQNFSSLTGTAPVYPTGWQGNTVLGATLAVGTPVSTAPAASDFTIVANSASSTSSGVFDYTGKIGFLSSASNVRSISLGLNTTGMSGIKLRFVAATVRYENSRTERLYIQYRTANYGNFTTVDAATASTTGADYVTDRTSSTSVTSGTASLFPQTMVYTMPSAIDNKSYVEVRWIYADVSGSVNRPSFAIDD
ncbi:MAG: IPT/TIG domain-containing protein, partial [Bacteroidota bacterium]